MSNSFKIISIDGNIGSGKSTLMDDLKKKYQHNTNIIFLEEPVGEWESIRGADGNTMIQKYYKNINKYAFSFQMMAFISRLSILQNKIKQLSVATESNNEDKCFYIFTERSLFSDRDIFAKLLYTNGSIEDVNYQIYLKWFDHFAFNVDVFIYINTPVKLCMERLTRRARLGEEPISYDYLTSCHDAHIEMFSNIHNKPIVELNGMCTTEQLTTQVWNYLHI